MVAERQIELVRLADLAPYDKNPRTHSEAQIDQLCASIREFGWTNPILVDHRRIIAGHGRHRAGVKLGLDKAPCIDLAGLTEDQKRAYVIADNKLALNAGWDVELLAAEVEALQASDFDIATLGFSDSELERLLGDEQLYTRKLEAPTYEPSPTKPAIGELVDRAKCSSLIADIITSDIPEIEKKFLLLAAERHTVFDFHKIADYYSHASPEMQDLMERSALVIIDMDKAIAEGYVQLTQVVQQHFAEDHVNA